MIEVNRKHPLVSIIVPTYNRASFLSECIDSVLAQSYPNWELIIVDDGSTDQSKSIIESYLTDERIRYHYQENQGQSVARSVAIDQACGEYIAFLDSDNMWLPNRLAMGLKAFDQDSSIGVSYGDIITINEQGDELSKENMTRHSGRIVDRLLMDNFVSMNTTLTKKTAIDQVGGMNRNIKRADDYDLWLRLSGQFKFKYIPEFMAYYRVMENQISSNKDGRFQSNEKIIKDFLENHTSSVSTLEARKGLGAFYARKAAYEASMSRFSRSLYDIFRSLFQFPFWQRPWRVLAKLSLGHYKAVDG